MNLLVIGIGIGHEKDLIIGIGIGSNFSYRASLIILLITVFHTLLFRSSQHFASQIAANPVNLTTEQRDGSNRLNSINAPKINK